MAGSLTSISAFGGGAGAERSISSADAGLASVAYLAAMVEAATTVPNAAGSSCAISDIGGRIIVRAVGIGTPFGFSAVTSASPMPSCVSSCSTA